MSSGSVERQRFYEKSYLAGLINFVVGRREETQDKHPMLKLHECLATICVAKARGEVIACYIEAAVGSGRRSTLHMSRNDNWAETAREYVAKVLGILAKMSSSSSTSSEGLQKEVYEYCKEKVEHRITKFLRTVKSVLEDDLSKTIEQLFPHDTPQEWRRLQKIVDVIKPDLEKLQRQLGGVTPPSGELLKSLPEKSEACRNTAAKWESSEGVLEVVREKFPYIESATDAALKKLKELNPFLAKTTKPPTTPLYLHAEMHFVQTLLSLTPPPQDVYIGISKLCCYLCYNCIRTVHDIRRSLHIHVKGTHNKMYNTWLCPSTFPDAPELAALESKLDALNRQILKDPKAVEQGTDESAPVSSLPLP